MKVSIAIPAYRSARTLPTLLTRIREVVRQEGWEAEVILVDDGSPERETWEVMRELSSGSAGEGLRVRALRLARNRGQHVALLCAMAQAGGEVVVTMDDDLQHAPEDLPRMVEAVRAGADLAVAAHAEKRHAAWRNAGGRLVDGLLRRIFHLAGDFQLTSYRAMTREVARGMVEGAGAYPYVTALALAHSSHRVNVPVEHRERAVGDSNYTWRKSLSLAANLVFGFTLLPVYVVAGLAALCMVLSVGVAGWAAYRAVWVGTGVPGWASLMVTTAFFQGMVLFCLAVYGVYLSRLSREMHAPRRPWVVAERSGV